MSDRLKTLSASRYAVVTRRKHQHIDTGIIRDAGSFYSGRRTASRHRRLRNNRASGIRDRPSDGSTALSAGDIDPSKPKQEKTYEPQTFHSSSPLPNALELRALLDISKSDN